MSFLVIGYTHEDVDQVFSTVSTQFSTVSTHMKETSVYDMEGTVYMFEPIIIAIVFEFTITVLHAHNTQI